ncbi:MAG: diaminopimelate epimerase [Syntrophaceae bacterium]|nr:diaminopimelate epimerase [Deltaproteobacteria bacterium]
MATAENITVSFTKMSGAGNDFIMITNMHSRLELDWPTFAVKYCTARTGIGADGVILLEPDEDTDFAFRIFNADGSEAEMCGNGARCAAALALDQAIAGESMHFRTLAGIIEARCSGTDTAIRMTDPSRVENRVTLDMDGVREIVHFINTGVPHAIVFTDRIEEAAVEAVGRAIRRHRHFAPEGTNVDFVQVLGPNHIQVRTYERGVEAETLACGTGAVASAICCFEGGKISSTPVQVTMKGGELKIDFTREKGSYRDVWLMGPVVTVFTGEVILNP